MELTLCEANDSGWGLAAVKVVIRGWRVAALKLGIMGGA